jgi:hypothetical protein
MIGLSYVSMYLLMYAMVNRLGDVYNSLNQVYMAGLMTAPMVVIEICEFWLVTPAIARARNPATAPSHPTEDVTCVVSTSLRRPGFIIMTGCAARANPSVPCTTGKVTSAANARADPGSRRGSLQCQTRSCGYNTVGGETPAAPRSSIRSDSGAARPSRTDPHDDCLYRAVAGYLPNSGASIQSSRFGTTRF